MSTTFPTLSRDPEPITEELANDPTIRSSMENGLVLTRARHTKLLKKWIVRYRLLTEADKTLLTDFQDNIVVGAGTITWSNPKTDASFTTRLAKPISFKVMSDHNDKWTAEIEMIEV